MLHLASYNIQYGRGKDDVTDLARIAAELGSPDLIALQEVERGSARNGFQDQPEMLAAFWPHMHWVYGPGIDLDASEVTPDGILRRRRQFGNMVLSRWPILSVVNHTLPKLALTGQFHLQRTLLETVIDTPDGALRFASVHLDHVSSDTRMGQVEMLEDICLNIRSRGVSAGGPVGLGWFDRPMPPVPDAIAVMGDMNFAPGGPEYAYLFGDLDLRGNRTTRAGGLADAWIAAGHAEEDGVTFPGSDIPDHPRRIDHCFVTQDLAHRVAAFRIGDDAVGSDHQPIFVDLRSPYDA
jgi:endonuclease/exonuclease/phosphatase family metal-dependent hydrolase